MITLQQPEQLDSWISKKFHGESSQAAAVLLKQSQPQPQALPCGKIALFISGMIPGLVFGPFQTATTTEHLGVCTQQSWLVEDSRAVVGGEE